MLDSIINFSAYITDLIPCVTYHYRVKAVNSIRTSYSPDMIFIPSIFPTLTTTSITDITSTTSLTGGSIINEGCLDITDRGVMLGHRGPFQKVIWVTYTHDGSGAGNYTSKLTGLSPSKTYFVKSYATTQNGTVYGPVKSFVTSP